MGNKQSAVTEPIETDIESVEALLDDLDIGENVELEAIEELVEDEVNDEELRDLEMQMNREAVYEEQESELETDTGAVAVAKEERKKNPVRVKNAGSKKVGVARTPKDLNAVASEFFVLEGDVTTMDDAAKDTAKATTMNLMPTQKKIAEKFENLFASLAVGKQPSVYVVQAFKLLDAKKSISSTDIVNDFKGTYKQGTAMSQTGQIMNLFGAVKIATRSKNTLVLNENSVVAQRLRDVITAAKGA